MEIGEPPLSGRTRAADPPPRAPRPAAPLLALLALLALPLLAPRSATAQVPPDLRHNPLAGSRVYGRANCAACHSVRGYGGQRASDLAALSGARSFYDLAAALWNHLPRDLDRMRELDALPPRLDGRQVGDLVAFLAALDYFEPRGEPDRGERLFREKRCIDCHQIGGAGGAVGPALDFLRIYASPIEVAAAMWNHGPRMLEEARERAVPRPEFSADEFVDLVAFLESGRRGLPGRALHVLPGGSEQGQRLFREKRCIRCHGPPGGGGRIGPDLAERAGAASLLEFAASMWNHQPEMLEEASARDFAIPRLEAPEMADIVAYLYAVRYFPDGGSTAGGRAVVRREGCLSCHTLRGRGAGDAGELSGLRSADTEAELVARLWRHLPAAAERGVPASRWPTLSADDVNDLVTFLRALSAPSPDAGSGPGSP